MKIVLDTNFLIAALIARGFSHQLLEHCALRHTLFTSDFILEETQEKLIEKFGYAPELAAEAVSVLRSRMTVVSASKLDNPVCRDPDDDISWLPRSAVNAIASSPATDLLVLKQHEGINIFNPRDFLMNEKVD